MATGYSEDPGNARVTESNVKVSPFKNWDGRAQSLERIPQRTGNYIRRGSSEKQPYRDKKQNKPLRTSSRDRSYNHDHNLSAWHNKSAPYMQNFSGHRHVQGKPFRYGLCSSSSRAGPPSALNSSPPPGQDLPGSGTGHRRNTSHNSERFNERKFGFKRLVDLSKKDADEIVMEMTTKKRDYTNLLLEDLSPDKRMLLAEILAKMTLSTMNENKTALFVEAFQPNVLEMLSGHSCDIIIKNFKYSDADIINYFQNLAIFYKDCIEILSNTAIDYLKDHLKRTILGLQNLKSFKQINVSEELEISYAELLSTLTSLEAAGKSCIPKRIKRKENLEWKPPGTNFREVSPLPLPQDVLLKSEVPLNPIVVEGPYKSVEHYLHVQFHLMREDFIIPLRDGISAYIERKSTKQSKFIPVENVRFYQNVQFLSQSVEGERILSQVLFDPSGRYKGANWKSSKKFMFGSLVCFSSDLFSSLFFGLITNRDVNLLAKGILQCELIGEVQEGHLFGQKFVMAENEVYFEAYHHVLSALKNFNETNFPLKEYIIDVSSEVILPGYLALNIDARYVYNGYEFQVMNRSTWPSKLQLKVNDSQFEALYSALTQKLVVIQGPPGTGKTYLGLLIAQLLLENKRIWKETHKKPILVVCYTNHALDQFLEGIHRFTANIVRVGGQSKNENMAVFNLKNKRRERYSSRALSDIEEELRSVERSINGNNILLQEVGKRVGIISLDILVDHMVARHSSWFQNKDSLLVEWLLEGAYENDEEGEDEFTPPDDDVISYAVTLHHIKLYILHLDNEIRKNNDDANDLFLIRNAYVNRFFYCKNKLMKTYEWNTELISQLNQAPNLIQLEPEQRWILYHYWVSKLIEKFDENMNSWRKRYQSLMKMKSEIIDAISLRVMSEADIVGITTTGAARQQALMQRLGANIVIVEEAAEVMESHVVVSLSDKCEHLILIGDHKQLRPSPAVYKLAKEYNFDISFFERMLKNNVPYDTLDIQHRMRPEIADLIIPAIYPALKNHKTVLNYDNIFGIEKNLFFITHNHPEEQVEFCLSKRNSKEAKFLIALSRHIVLQGYDPSQITILTVYLGQMFTLMEERERHAIIKDVKITCVDNYQGEENDIILLSLVRSNDERKIGFLGTENRVCVALSRAKKGLYITGNMELLASKSSLWNKVKEVLWKKGAISEKLTLKCVKHPQQLTEVCKAEDFVPITEGGCTLMCNEKLDCGHTCKKICHMTLHTEGSCPEVCEKVMCVYNHKCKKLCSETCGDCMIPLLGELPCGHWATLPCHKDPSEYKCQELVEVTLPACSHKMMKKCFQKVKDLNCPIACDSRLPCGHICEKTCHVTYDPDHLKYKCMRPCGRTNLNCTKEHLCQKKCYEECSLCMTIIKTKLPGCDHYYDMQCSADPNTLVCQKPCQKMLSCGHKCCLKCFEKCGNCAIMVSKEVEECKHKIRVKCCVVPVRSLCQQKCERFLPCGHKCDGICGISCSILKCEALVQKAVISPCGHEVRLFCHELQNGYEEDSLPKRCIEACSKLLSCTHFCKGTCGSCLQGRIHIQCQEKCGRNLICGHVCKVSCSQSCPPCKEDCFIQCRHTKCKKKCGVPCVSCKEDCDWRCKHQKCTKKCGQICDRPPCDEHCQKKLKCGHPCLGFCGEDCPPLCRLCNADELEDILVMLPSDDENPRLVFLPDCKHVFDSKGLEKWLSMDEGSIKMIVCPQCKTPIQNAKRFGNIMKKHFKNVLKVKTKLYNGLGNDRKNLSVLLQRLCSLMNILETKDLFEGINLKSLLKRKDHKGQLSASETNSLQARTQFVLAVAENYRSMKKDLDSAKDAQCKEAANFLIKIIVKNLEFISPQEHEDFTNECMKFQLMLLLSVIESTLSFKNPYTTSWRMKYDECKTIICSLKPFKKNSYDDIKNKLDDVHKSLRGPIGVSKLEMFDVVKALNMHQGHWYTCPNGHLYVITECGGAVMESRCNECGERIGGGGHRHLVTNTRLSSLPEGL